MSPTARSAVTLAVLACLLVAAAAWGWSALTAPLPEQEEPPVCVEREVAQGDRVFRDQVTVSVYNASRRSGLAGATLAQLEERGFHPGAAGNAPDRGVSGAQIWTDDRRNPAVRLVRSQFQDAKVARGPQLGPGVVVVLGTDYRGLVKGRASARARQDATYCGPTDAG